MSRGRVLAVLVVVLAGCAAPGSSGSSPSPDGSAPTTLGPTPSSVTDATNAPSADPTIGPILSTIAPAGPSWTPRPAESALVGAAVRPTVAELNVREVPSISSKSLGIVTPDEVLVVRGLQSFEVDGYTWVRATVVSAIGRLPELPDMLPGEGEPLAGWIAIARGATTYVERLAPRCPSAIDLWTIAAMLDSELLACFGDETIVLEAVFGCGGCGGYAPGSMEPAWLAHPYGLTFGILSVAPLTRDRWAALVGHAPPEGPTAPPVGSIIRVRGHFDDARAGECRITLPMPWDRSDNPELFPVAQANATLYCRQRFVVESYEILGTDPDFPYG